MPTIETLLSKTVQEGECQLWTGYIAKSGYGLVWADGKNRQVHRVAYELYNGPIPDGLDVMHSCDVRPCIAKAHLSAGTRRENMQDMVSKGRQNLHRASGEGLSFSKLSEQKVAEIRCRYIPRDRVNGQKALAREFGVCQATIWHVVHGKTWSS
jgi:hypothetical protein